MIYVLTGQLEVFHNALLKYCPKRLHFEYQSMQARTMLAIMDNNENHDSPRKPEETSGKYQKYTNYKFSYDQLKIVIFHI